MDKNELTDLLKRLIEINSVFPHEQELSKYIEKYLIKLGFVVERVPVVKGRDNIVATFGKKDNYLCFYGHMDTVPPDPLWKQDPFELRQANSKFRGLGVADMKGGIALIMLAAKYASQKNLPLKLVFGVDEENISLGSFKLTQTNHLKDVSFMISAESGQVLNENSDFAINYGRKGYFKLQAHVSGIKAHAARSDLARNAITEAANLVRRVTKISFPKHKHLGKVEVIPTSLHSSTDSFSIPHEAEITFNVLTVPGIKSDLIVKKLQNVADRSKINARFSVSERETAYLESYEVDLKNEFLKKIEKEVFAKYKVAPLYAQSVADENQFASRLGIPVISIGPVGGGDHTANEWVSVSSLLKTLGAYKDIIHLYHE